MKMSIYKIRNLNRVILNINDFIVLLFIGNNLIKYILNIYLCFNYRGWLFKIFEVNLS